MSKRRRVLTGTISHFDTKFFIRMSFVRITRLKLSNFLRNVKNVEIFVIKSFRVGYNSVCQISQNLKNHKAQI